MTEHKRATWALIVGAAVLAVLACRRPWWLRWWALLLWLVIALSFVQAAVLAVADLVAGGAR